MAKMKLVAGKEQEYADWFDKNDDPSSRRCFTYAEDWAELMEKTMVENAVDVSNPVLIMKFMVEYAKPMSHLADTDGITGFMYGAAVSILAQVWIHGEQLRRWHNLDTQIGNEGEKANESGGTLNPALLNIG